MERGIKPAPTFLGPVLGIVPSWVFHPQDQEKPEPPGLFGAGTMYPTSCTMTLMYRRLAWELLFTEVAGDI